MNEKMRLFEGKPFHASSLRHVGHSLGAAFQNAVSKFRNREFVTVVSANSQETTVTFEQFARDVTKIAAKLSFEIASAESSSKMKIDTVANFGTNTYANLVGIWAAIASGKTLTLLNPTETPQQITTKLSRIGTSYRLTETTVSNWLSSGEPGELKFHASPETSFQVFTSGSTGYGKVVRLTAENVLSNVDALLERHQFCDGDSITTPMPVFHVNALFFSFFCSLFSGTRFYLFEKFDPVQFTEKIGGLDNQSERSIVVSAAPTILAVLVRSAKFLPKAPFLKVRYFVSAASALDSKLLAHFSTIFKTPVIQGYGLSETVNFSALMPHDLSPDLYARVSTDGKFTSIGTAVYGNHILIIRPDGSEVEAGEVGELVMRGHNIMLGYKDDDGRECFAGDYFHSGDLGYFKHHQNEKFFYITGRIKDVIKRAGNTISLREVDDLLMSVGLGQKDAIAFSFSDPIVGEEIGAALAFNDESEVPGDQKIREILTESFAIEMCPRILLITFGSLRNPSGKPIRADIRRTFESLEKNGPLKGLQILRMKTNSRSVT